MESIEYTENCPVCGYNLGFIPWGEEGDLEICSCCGIQYNYNDATEDIERRLQIYRNLRKDWVQNGMKFKHQQPEFNEPPENWNPKEQLKNIPKEFLGPDEKY